MPRGVPNKKQPTPAVAPAADEPDALIILQPDGGGRWRLNAYGVEAGEIMRAMRLTLIHLAGRQAGVTVIEETISPRSAVVLPVPAQRAATKPKAAVRSVSNGRRPVPRDYDEDEDPDEIDLRELMEER